jgi:hypothetical protein
MPEMRPVLWVICGIGRGVGKTKLALDLCRALPDAVYAKQGTSRQFDGKPENYFHDDRELDAFLDAEARSGRRHLVVESNALARRGSGDIIVFLDVPAGTALRAEPRSDAAELRQKALMRLGRDPSEPIQVDELQERLARLGLEEVTRSAVIKVFQAQDAWNRGREWS